MGTGVKFDVTALRKDTTTMLMLPAFVLLFLVIRGLPVLTYRKDIARPQQLPFGLFSAVPSVSIIALLTETGVHAKAMSPDAATASSAPRSCPP